ncbi:MAG: hypothetical protein K2P81_15250 [Bacteriovoracaceae bacterium]|nr:hypothetical protein [Bacteriovoracaceae bacterium]
MTKIFGLCLIFLSVSALANFDAVEEENRYNAFVNLIAQSEVKLPFVFESAEQKLLVDALWDSQEVGKMDIRDSLMQITDETYPLKEQLRLAVLTYRSGLQQEINILGNTVLTELPLDSELGTLVLSLRYDLNQMGLEYLVEAAKKLYPFQTRWVTASERPVGDQTQLAIDLWTHEVDLSRHAGGAFNNGIKIFMFCRTQRLHACLMAVRDSSNRPVYNNDGTMWTQPALASSAHDLPSYQRNGNTPAGIHHIEGVMPTADAPMSFGKFRRLILDFVDKRNNEAASRELLPPSSLSSDWWRPATIARDIGRSLLRIHGTGRLNEEPTSSWFPFRRTSGCIAKRENTYNGIEYRDQAELLDTLVAARGLEVNYPNQEKIRGILYLIELNDEDRAVTPNDLKDLGIQ